jgi:hypothetical protein
VHVEGVLGAHVLVRDNDLSGCTRGVLIAVHGATPQPALWTVEDNLAVGATQTVDAPASVRRSGNVP